MSRTKRGAKFPGYDYWGRRPFSSNGFGPWVKLMTHRAERRMNKAEARRQEKAPGKDSPGLTP